MEPGPGMLLVASPELTDPNFADAVVLLLDTEDGALGVLVNRPSTVPVDAVLSDWHHQVSDPGVLFQGGPVSPEGAIAVAQLRRDATEPIGYRSVTEDLGLIDLDTPVELVSGSLAAMRVFAGYAGWSAGQLQGEIERGDWYVVPGDPTDAFREDSSGLWRDVLRRQPGELAWHSTRPVDPDLN